ncbi:hypothetical protein XENOCAPTIV_017791 [Xenoophorus captivus]|uniref:3-dehydroquinate synthase domain-containing protein n=1 Tax=Xenoophorus captivus TaxID=1517983 RepID=A0ABV0RZJ6_9TELE
MSNSKPVKRFIVIDKTVHKLYGSKVSQYFDERGVIYKILPLTTTEENKSMELVTKILEEIHHLGIDRRSEPIIALGGGVCLDVVGLAASLYRRRTPYIRVPTTLLSYVDASVGAKTGVNFAGGKNKLGSYKVLPALLHGEAVNIDMSFMVYVAQQKGLLTKDEKDRIIQCMLGLELPVWHQECSLALVQKSLRERLKHSAGSVRMPLPTGLGRAGKTISSVCLPSSI